MSDDQTEGDQTEAELERTRQVVAAAMAEQVKANDAAAAVPSEDAEAPAAATEQPKGNASRDEWAAYAKANGYDVDDDWSRDDIRDLFAEEN
jgi:hypothetical protein